MSEKPNYLQITRFNSIRHEKIMFFLKTTPFSQKVNRGVDASCQSSGFLLGSCHSCAVPAATFLLPVGVWNWINQKSAEICIDSIEPDSWGVGRGRMGNGQTMDEMGSVTVFMGTLLPVICDYVKWKLAAIFVFGFFSFSKALFPLSTLPPSRPWR